MADKKSRRYGRRGHSKARLPLLSKREGTINILQKVSLPRKPGPNTKNDVTGASALDRTLSTKWLQSPSLHQPPRLCYKCSLQTTCHNTKLMTTSTGMWATPNRPQHFTYRAWASKESRIEGWRQAPRQWHRTWSGMGTLRLC